MMRERQPGAGQSGATLPTLRLVPAADEAEVPIVPRPATTDEPPETEPVLPDDPVGPLDATTDVAPATGESALARDVVEESTALVPVPQRVVDAEPARVVEPLVAPATAAGSPAASAVPAGFPPVVDEPPVQRPHALPAAMPHPITRPERAHSPTGAGGARKRRGRGVLAFIAAVAVASVATLGLLNLAGGSSPTSAPTTKAPISGGPSSSRRASKTAKPRASAKSATNPRTTKPQKPKTTPRRPVAPTTSARTQKPSARTKPKAQATSKPKPKPKVTSSSTRPKAKPPTTQQSKPTPKPKAPAAKAAAAATEARRFAWAPVDGAVSYHVELFRGADRVLAKETTQPILELGPSWRYEGKTIQLTPGSYRWYVWPVTKSGRATQAVVQAKLDIP
jgi:hypothetical protein